MNTEENKPIPRPDYEAMGKSVGGMTAFIAAIQRLEDRVIELERTVHKLEQEARWY